MGTRRDRVLGVVLERRVVERDRLQRLHENTDPKSISTIASYPINSATHCRD